MHDLKQPIASGRTAEIYAWEDGHVLKLYRSKFPRGWVDYEARATSAAYAAGAPAPAVLGTVDHLDRYGVIFERIQGRSILATLTRSPWRIGALGRLMAELHAGMHARAAFELPDQVERLEESIRKAPHLSESQKNAAQKAITFLPRGEALCHMDFHPDNVVLTPSGPCIIDWMTACSGSPWADVARTVLMLTIGEPPQGSPLRMVIALVRDWLRRSYLSRYLSLRPDGQGELRAWLPIMAAARLVEEIPNEKEKLLGMIQPAFGN